MRRRTGFETNIFIEALPAARRWGYARRHFQRLLTAYEIEPIIFEGVGFPVHVYLIRDLEVIPPGPRGTWRDGSKRGKRRKHPCPP